MRKLCALGLLFVVGCCLPGCGATLREAVSNDHVSNTRATGVYLAPAGTPILGLGEIQHTFSPTYETADGEIRSPLVVNRTDVETALGGSATSTTIIGDAGDEIREGGEVIPHIFESIYGTGASANVPVTLGVPE